MPAVSSSTRTTISELLARARAGNRQALNQLFGSCRNYVSVLAHSQMETNLQAKCDPSDLVQQTLLEAYDGFAKFHGVTEAEWLAWLRGILGHNAADVIRHYHGTERRQARREMPLDNAPPGSSSAENRFDPADSNETPLEQLIRQERDLLLADAVAELEADQRTVILLRNLRRLPFDEVARQMGRSRPAVQMLWMRAIRNLQNRLVEESVEARPAP